MDQRPSFKTKHARKVKKYTNILKEKLDVDSSKSTTKFLAICNSGLTTGLSREKVLEALPENLIPLLKDIEFVAGESITFLTCRDADSAQIILEALQDNESCDLFLLFVSNVPRIEEKQQACLPIGLIIVENFVSKEEEKVLLGCINWNNVESPDKGQALKHRSVRHYGFQFEYGSNNVNPDKPLEEKIPVECDFVSKRLAEQKLVDWVPEQLTVNQYEPGQGIPPHIDTHSAFLEPIMSLSLESDVVMEFRKNSAVVPVLLPRRSLLLMTGESRYCWTHGITPHKSDVVTSPLDGKMTLVKRERRTSFTFRRLLRRACDCPFPQYCDSQQEKLELGGNNSVEINSDETAAKLENLHVHQVYEEIASHFSETRHKPWPNVKNFVESQEPAAVILDVGCGNGKYLGLNSRAFQIGCDMSQQLAEICRHRSFEAFLSNCLYVPFRDCSADCCISIAVIHHLSTQSRRLRAIKEIARVLRQGGRALIYVWAKNQQKDKQKSSYLKQQCTNAAAAEESQPPSSPFSLPVHTNRTQFCHSDLLVPWKLRAQHAKAPSAEPEEVYFRYYHMFEEGELELLCAQVDEACVEKSYYDQGNWCVILRKL